MVFLRFTCPRTNISHQITVAVNAVGECEPLPITDKAYFKFKSFIRKRRRTTFLLHLRENLDDLKEWGTCVVELSDTRRAFAVRQRDLIKNNST